MIEEVSGSAGVELPAHYYRDNFVALCAAVQSQYGDLLQPAERELLTQFHNLDHAAQCLYVRLVSRVGPLFRVARLEYPEIGPTLGLDPRGRDPWSEHRGGSYMDPGSQGSHCGNFRFPGSPNVRDDRRG